MTLPADRHPINAGGLVDPVWLRFFQQLDRALVVGGTTVADAVTQIATALGSPDGTVANIPALSESQIRILQGAGIEVTGNASVGYTISLRPVAAASVTYDNTTSGLSADDVQDAIDELAAGGISASQVFNRIDGNGDIRIDGAGDLRITD